MNLSAHNPDQKTTTLEIIHSAAGKFFIRQDGIDIVESVCDNWPDAMDYAIRIQKLWEEGSVLGNVIMERIIATRKI